MIYEIMNRVDAHRASGEGNAPVTAIISITDTGDDKNSFYPTSWIKAVLHIQFDDVIDHRKNCITKEQAKEIAAFAQENYEQIERFIIHCEYGQSRSAGVAAAICEFFEGHDNGISTDNRYFPNWTCYKYILEVLNGIRKKES